MAYRPATSEIGKRVRMPSKMQKSETNLSSLPKQICPTSHTQADTLDEDGHRSQRVLDNQAGRFNEKSLPGFDSIADNSVATLSQRLAKENVPELAIGRRKSSGQGLPASILSVQDAIVKATERGSQSRRQMRFKYELAVDSDSRRKVVQRKSLDRHFASAGHRQRQSHQQMPSRSSLQLPSVQVMASALINDHKNDERVGRLLSTYVNVDKRSGGAGGLLIRRSIARKAKQQHLKLALSKKQDQLNRPKLESKPFDLADDDGQGDFVETANQFEASFGDPRPQRQSPDRVSLD